MRLVSVHGLLQSAPSKRLIDLNSQKLSLSSVASKTNSDFRVWIGTRYVSEPKGDPISSDEILIGSLEPYVKSNDSV